MITETVILSIVAVWAVIVFILAAYTSGYYRGRFHQIRGNPEPKWMRRIFFLR